MMKFVDAALVVVVVSFIGCIATIFVVVAVVVARALLGL